MRLKSCLPLILAVLAGCSQRPPVNPGNEINEPVFFDGPYVSLGAAVGASIYNMDSESSYRVGPWLEPRIVPSAYISPWASFVFWPLLWNILLTGEQHADGTVLKTEKLHVAALLGLNSLSYSQREDWRFGGIAGVRAKYLFSPRVFSEVLGGYESSDLNSRNGWISTDILYGVQITPRSSFSFSGSSTLYRAEAGSYFNNRGIAFRDQDVKNEIRARFKTYLTEKHILGPEVGYGLINLRAGKDDFYLVGLTYRYVMN